MRTNKKLEDRCVWKQFFNIIVVEPEDKGVICKYVCDGYHKMCQAYSTEDKK